MELPSDPLQDQQRTVTIQPNGVIRNEHGFAIAQLLDEVSFDDIDHAPARGAGGGVMADEFDWNTVGCGDNSCVFPVGPGMHTNGGCRCFKYGLPDKERRRKERGVRKLRATIAELERENAALKQDSGYWLGLMRCQTLRDVHEAMIRLGKRAAVAEERVTELTGRLTLTRDDRDALAAQVAELRAALERSGGHLVEMQRHRDRWRRFAKEGGEQPTDFIENSDSEGTQS